MMLLRKKLGLTQQTLAALTGLSRSTIVNFETGKREPRLGALERIADALGVSVSELIAPLDLPQPQGTETGGAA